MIYKTAADALNAVDTHVEELERSLTSDIEILMVEDDAAQVLVYKILFERFRARVTYARTGSEALALLKDCCPFDLVMIDLRLNNCATGVDVLNRCDQFQGCESVVITGDISALQSMGYDGVATVCFKPLTLSKLLTVLNKVRLTRGIHGIG